MTRPEKKPYIPRNTAVHGVLRTPSPLTQPDTHP